MTLKPKDTEAAASEDDEQVDLEAEAERDVEDAETDDLEDGAGDSDGGGEERRDGRPKGLSEEDRKGLQFMRDLKAGVPYAVQEARRHLETLEGGASSKQSKDEDTPLTRRELRDFEQRQAAIRKADKLADELDRIAASEQFKGVIKSGDREDILEYAWRHDLTVRQAVKLMPRFEKRVRDSKAKAKKQAAAPSGGTGGKSSGGRQRADKSIDQLREEARKAGPGPSPARDALKRAQFEEARARKRK